jgi:hypothetical protein
MVFYTHCKDLGQVFIEKKNTVTTDHTFEGGCGERRNSWAIIFDSYRFLVWWMILSPWGRPAHDLKIFKKKKKHSHLTHSDKCSTRGKLMWDTKQQTPAPPRPPFLGTCGCHKLLDNNSVETSLLLL